MAHGHKTPKDVEDEREHIYDAYLINTPRRIAIFTAARLKGKLPHVAKQLVIADEVEEWLSTKSVLARTAVELSSGRVRVRASDIGPATVAMRVLGIPIHVCPNGDLDFDGFLREWNRKPKDAK